MKKYKILKKQKNPELVGIICCLGRTMRIELTHAWFTARCVNPFTTFAKSQEIVYKNISRL